jgi:hypothetical protein
MLYPEIIAKVGAEFNNAYVLVETNDIGQQVVDILHSEIEYDNIFTSATEKGKQFLTSGFKKVSKLGIMTSQRVKRQGCLAFKNLIEEQKLLLFDADIIHEISTFIEKGNTFQADEGYHDDLIMTLVLFGWLTTQPFFSDLMDVNVREGLYKSQMQDIESNLVPYLRVDGQEEETFVASGDLWFTGDGKLFESEKLDIYK